MQNDSGRTYEPPEWNNALLVGVEFIKQREDIAYRLESAADVWHNPETKQDKFSLEYIHSLNKNAWKHTADLVLKYRFHQTGYNDFPTRRHLGIIESHFDKHKLSRTCGELTRSYYRWHARGGESERRDGGRERKCYYFLFSFPPAFLGFFR